MFIRTGFCIYFFDDLQRNPTELRRSILHFLRADPDKPSRRLTADYNSLGWDGKASVYRQSAIACGSILQEGAGRPVRGDWEGQPEIGRHDTVFRYSFLRGIGRLF